MSAKPRRARTRTSASQQIAFDPFFTEDQVSQIETDRQGIWGTHHRLMLSVLSRSGQDLAQGFHKVGDGETALFDLAMSLDEFQAYCTSCAELAEMAISRLVNVAQLIDETGSKS